MELEICIEENYGTKKKHNLKRKKYKGEWKKYLDFDIIIAIIALVCVEAGTIYGSVDWMIHKDFKMGLIGLIGINILIVSGIAFIIKELKSLDNKH